MITGVPKCSTCSIDGTKCLKCQDGYVFDEEGKCVPENMTSSCLVFNPSNYSMCEICSD